MDLQKHQEAYDKAMKRSDRPHKDAKNDAGHCSVCGCDWPDDPDYLPHLCPPGFFYQRPRD